MSGNRKPGDFLCPPTRGEWKAVMAEMIGMMLFVFVGVGTAHQQFRAMPSNSYDPGTSAAPILTISLAFGLGITAFVYACAGPSGGHLNPAVTFCLMAMGQISVPLGFIYVLAQMIGATLGSFLAAFADPYLAGFAVNTVASYKCGLVNSVLGNVQDCCERFNCTGVDASLIDETTTFPGLLATETLMWGPAFTVELVGTFMLCFTVLMTAVYKDSVAGNLAPVAIGLSVFFAHLIAIPITNCSINPARSFGAAVVASALPTFTDFNMTTGDQSITDAWIQMPFFWAVPIVGGLIAALTFYCTFLDAGNADKDTGYDVDPVEDQRGDGQKANGDSTADPAIKRVDSETSVKKKKKKKKESKDTGEEEEGKSVEMTEKQALLKEEGGGGEPAPAEASP